MMPGLGQGDPCLRPRCWQGHLLWAQVGARGGLGSFFWNIAGGGDDEG